MAIDSCTHLVQRQFAEYFLVGKVGAELTQRIIQKRETMGAPPAVLALAGPSKLPNNLRDRLSHTAINEPGWPLLALTG